MDKLQRIVSLSTQADRRRNDIMNVIYQLGELYLMEEREEERKEEEFLSLLKLGVSYIRKYNKILRKIHLEMEAIRPARKLPPEKHEEWLFFKKTFIYVMNDAEKQSDIFFNILQLFRNLSGISHD